jgi:hypothetical protein
VADLGSWFLRPPDTGSFDFCPTTDSGPWEVVVRRTIVTVGPAGPVPTGRTLVRHFVDGALVSSRTIEASDG